MASSKWLGTKNITESSFLPLDVVWAPAAAASFPMRFFAAAALSTTPSHAPTAVSVDGARWSNADTLKRG